MDIASKNRTGEKRMKRGFLGSMLLVLALGLMVSCGKKKDDATAAPANCSRPLQLLWNGNNVDNMTAATDEGVNGAKGAGYQFIRNEGYISATRQPGMVPLQLFYKDGDNFTTATDAGAQSAVGAGYTLIRIEGYVYPASRPGTIPLKLYFTGHDNLTLASSDTEKTAQAGNYALVRIEGYVCVAPSP